MSNAGSLTQPGEHHRLRFYEAADFLLGTLSAVFALALFMRTLAPGVLGGDSGEFQFAAWVGGFAHPTGYPLYLILGYLWTHLLPWQDPAWRMNAFSALWGGITTGLVYLLVVRLLFLTSEEIPAVAQRAIAVAAALTVAVAPTFWSQAVIAEVYTLNTTLIVGVWVGLVLWARRVAENSSHGQRPLYWAAACFGLGLAHHRVMLLLAPVIMLYLLYGRVRGEPWRSRLVGLGHALPLVFLPLLLYAYIPLRAPQTPYVNIVISASQTLNLYQADFAGFIAYITGQAFSGEILSRPQVIDRLLPALQRFPTELTWAGSALGLLGLSWLFRQHKALFGLLSLSFGVLFAFNLAYGIGDIQIYYIPLFILTIVWMALGLAALAHWFGHLWPADRQDQALHAGAGVVALLAFALPVWLLLSGYARVDQSGATQWRTGWQQLLAEPIPGGAIVISNDRDEMTPLMYYQYVEAQRTDLTGLFPLIGPPAEWGDIGQVVDSALRSNRPVYLVKPMPGLDVKFQLEPAGSLMRVAGPAVTRPPERTRTVTYSDTVRLTGYDVRPTMIVPSGQLTVTLYWLPLNQFTDGYTTFVHLIDADGAMVGQSDHPAGGEYYPTSLWRPGEHLRDTHVLNLGASLGRSPYQIVVGLYRRLPDLQHLGRPEQVGVLVQRRDSDQIPPDLARPLSFTFGNQLALNGYELKMEANRLTFRLFWQAVTVPKQDYTFFVHVVDSTGRIVAQQDQQPAIGQMPTRAWPRGYLLADVMSVDLPATLPAGRYSLLAGVYDAATLTPLEFSDARGHIVGTEASLGELIWPPG